MWTHRLRAALHSDFAFRQDTTLAALPLVIAFLTLLSISMTHSAAYIKQVTLSGSEELSQRLHLHLPHHMDDMAAAQLYETLNSMDGIDQIERISRSQVHQFLGLWLGLEQDIASGMPVPTILDITLNDPVQRDTVQAAIQKHLDASVEGALLESYDDSIAAFNRSSELVKTGIYILGLIVIACTTLIVVITSRINLGVHRRHIEILHHLGASDTYINRQFIKRAALMALQGVLAGTFLSVLFIETVKSRFDAAFLIDSATELQAIWVYYLLNPLLIILLVMAASWASIEAQLRKMH